MKNALLTRIILGSSAVVGLYVAGGCTAGVLVDSNWQNAKTNETAGASITFRTLDANNNYSGGTEYTFNLGGQPYLSFDPYAPAGATSSRFPGLQNQKTYVPPGNYQVQYFQPQMGFAYSPKFTHAYDQGSCEDTFNGGTATEPCDLYYFQFLIESDPQYAADCSHNGGGLQTLPTYNGYKVIPLCAAF